MTVHQMWEETNLDWNSDTYEKDILLTPKSPCHCTMLLGTDCKGNNYPPESSSFDLFLRARSRNHRAALAFLHHRATAPGLCCTSDNCLDFDLPGSEYIHDCLLTFTGRVLVNSRESKLPYVPKMLSTYLLWGGFIQ